KRAWYFVGEPRNRQSDDRLAQRPMLTIEQIALAAPLLLGGIGESEKIVARDREGAALLARQPASHAVLPVGRMQHQIADVVPAGFRTPGSRSRRHSAKRSMQVGSVPGGNAVGLVEHVKEESHQACARGHLRLPSSSGKRTLYSVKPLSSAEKTVKCDTVFSFSSRNESSSG